MKAFTDYPIVKRITRDQHTYEAEALCFDKNKYVIVSYEGKLIELKGGYLHSNPDLLNDEIIDFQSLPRYPMDVEYTCR